MALAYQRLGTAADQHETAPGECYGQTQCTSATAQLQYVAWAPLNTIDAFAVSRGQSELVEMRTDDACHTPDTEGLRWNFAGGLQPYLVNSSDLLLSAHAT